MFCNKVSQWLGISVISPYSLELQAANSQVVIVPGAAPASQSLNSQVPNSQVSISSIGFSQSQTVQTQPSQNALSRDTPFTQIQLSQVPNPGACVVPNRLFVDSSAGARSEISGAKIDNAETGSKQLFGGKSLADDTRLLSYPQIGIHEQGTRRENFDIYNGNSVYNVKTTTKEPSPVEYLRPENKDTFRRFLSHINTSGDNDTSCSTSLFDTSRPLGFDTSSDSAAHYIPLEEKLSFPTITENDLLFALDKVPEKKKLKRARHHYIADPVEDALMQTIQSVASQQVNSVLDLSDEQLCLKISRRLHSTSFARVLSRIESVIVPSFEAGERGA